MWTIRWLINELDTVVIQKFSQNWLNKETVVKAAIIHHDTIAALKKDTSVRPLNFNSIFKKVKQLKSIGWAVQNVVVVYAEKLSGAS